MKCDRKKKKKANSAFPKIVFFLSLFLSLLKNQTRHERQNVQAEFEKLRAILDSEETKELQKLKVEETATLCTMANAENELAQQSQLVRNLISEIEHRLRGSTMQMLQVRVGKKPEHLRHKRNEAKCPLLSSCGAPSGAVTPPASFTP